MQLSLMPYLQRLTLAALLGLTGVLANVSAQAAPDPLQSSPAQFVLDAANQALTAVKAGGPVTANDTARVNTIVDKYILPYINLQKTTRLAAGRYWRQASAAQQTALTAAFRNTLVNTYSAALARVDATTTITALPSRADPKSNDQVVRTLISQSNAQPINVDYRLERTAPQGWKIYDVNIEGIWLIENYRNQFAQQINQNGIDGLIQALNQRNK